MTTDLKDKGLESLIVRCMTGPDSLKVATLDAANRLVLVSRFA
jgi:hypothetical protein